MIREAELRDARLTGSREPEVPGGGIPLPGVFQAILEYGLDYGRFIDGGMLEKILRRQLEHMKSQRVLHVWGSWAGLGRDAMSLLAERGKVAVRPDGWALDPSVRSGARIWMTLGEGRIRFTPRARADRESREDYAWARRRGQEYQLALENRGLWTGAAKKTFEAHLASLHYEEEPDEEEREEREGEKKELSWADRHGWKKGMVAQFTLDYIRGKNGEPVTIKEIMAAFDAGHPPLPGQKGISSGTPHAKLEWAVRMGMVRKEMLPSKKNHPTGFYRWIGDTVRERPQG